MREKKQNNKRAQTATTWLHLRPFAIPGPMAGKEEEDEKVHLGIANGQNNS